MFSNCSHGSPSDRADRDPGTRRGGGAAPLGAVQGVRPRASTGPAPSHRTPGRSLDRQAAIEIALPALPQAARHGRRQRRGLAAARLSVLAAKETLLSLVTLGLVPRVHV